MKKPLLLLILLFLVYNLSAQNAKELKAGYYTVVAAYDDTKEEYAIRYVQTLLSKGLSAAYGLNTNRNLYFVYLQEHDNLTTALRAMYSLRKQGQFPDAWVRVVPGVIGQEGEEAKPVIVDPVTTTEPSKLSIEKEKISEVKEIVKEELPAPVQQVVTAPMEQITTEAVPEAPEEKLTQQYPMTLGNSEIFLSLFNASNNRIVDGEIMVIDTERGKLLKTVKGNEYLSLPDPKSVSGKVSLIADVFGYRKIQHELNFKNPEADTLLPYVDMMGLSFVVSFDLVRYRTGDIRSLSHVYFFNDAAVMIPESRYELNQLLQMMTENPRMKIRLHGHTNGHFHGKIIKMGSEKNFFSIGKDAVNTVGSAKDLSYERAEVIKEYLLANAITEDRVSVKGWGGKKPLYDKHSANARKNVRVEVEVLAD